MTYTGSEPKHQNYVNWLKGNDNIEIIKLSAGENFDDIKNCEGLVLSGGVDIHPELYGGDPDYPDKPPVWERERDIFEKSVFEFALEHNMPVLGVCRGLQLINISLNGTLIRDLGKKGNEIHRNVKGDKKHPVQVGGGTLLHAIAHEERGEANSAHHQAIDQLGDGLKVNCRADDGTIEGIEWADKAGKPFMMAVQWHPERMFINQLRDSFLYKNIRDRFIDEIKNNRG